MVEFKAIGMIHTPFDDPAGMPIQPSGAEGVRGTIEIFPDFTEGLKDLDGFSHLILLYVFHRSKDFCLKVTPFMDTAERGVFSTRAPNRPNPIGLSVVRLVEIDGERICVENIDVLDGTPLLDIKPYVPAFDQPSGAIQTGWLGESKRRADQMRSDDRFQ
jgi:tRNA-Thr(GGU) m(6)t(6)A37 methyltransferase TsaA